MYHFVIAVSSLLGVYYLSRLSSAQSYLKMSCSVYRIIKNGIFLLTKRCVHFDIKKWDSWICHINTEVIKWQLDSCIEHIQMPLSMSSIERYTLDETSICIEFHISELRIQISLNLLVKLVLPLCPLQNNYFDLHICFVNLKYIYLWKCDQLDRRDRTDWSSKSPAKQSVRTSTYVYSTFLCTRIQIWRQSFLLSSIIT